MRASGCNDYGVFHVELRELRQFPHVAHAFNLSETELSAKVLVPWSEGSSC